MCHYKSALVMKDKVFMPNYNSHSTMLEKLGITDDKCNPNFVRVEVTPPDGSIFSDISNWNYRVDQDFRPDWYVAEYDEQRTRESITLWAKDRFGKNTAKKQLGDLAVGATFQIGNIEYIVLDKNGDDVSCLAVDVIREETVFDGNSNNFATSAINKYLNGEYYNWLAGQVGAENIVEHTVDLTDYYGKKAYALASAKVSLLTLEQYRKYESIIPKTEQYYWLATPLEKDSWGVCCVCADGDVDYYVCDWHGGAVCPFCIFKSSIFVSCEE